MGQRPSFSSVIATSWAFTFRNHTALSDRFVFLAYVTREGKDLFWNIKGFWRVALRKSTVQVTSFHLRPTVNQRNLHSSKWRPDSRPTEKTGGSRCAPSPGSATSQHGNHLICLSEFLWLSAHSLEVVLWVSFHCCLLKKDWYSTDYKFLGTKQALWN